jgi:excisionase family DNA binding protein
MAEVVKRTTLETKEAADYLGVSVDTLRKWIREEGLPVVKIGRKHLFKTIYIDHWMEQRMNLDGRVSQLHQQSYGKLRSIKP